MLKLECAIRLRVALESMFEAADLVPNCHATCAPLFWRAPTSGHHATRMLLKTEENGSRNFFSPGSISCLIAVRPWLGRGRRSC
jgi:hypothetical protein